MVFLVVPFFGVFLGWVLCVCFLFFGGVLLAEALCGSPPQCALAADKGSGNLLIAAEITVSADALYPHLSDLFSILLRA